MTGMHMRRAIWGPIYCLIGAGLIGAGLLLASSVRTNSEPLALTGVTCCIVSLTIAHFAFNAGWLKAGRRKLEADREAHYEERAAVAAQRAMMDNEFHRATRSLEEEQRVGREQLAADREAMLCEIEANAFELKREGFEMGFSVKTVGLAPDAPSNVFHLRAGNGQSTTMGSGALSN